MGPELEALEVVRYKTTLAEQEQSDQKEGSFSEDSLDYWPDAVEAEVH